MKKALLLVSGFAIFFIFNNCKREIPAQSGFVLHAPASTGVHFSNTLYETTDLNIITFEYFYNGAGVGVGDFNADGLQDLFFAGNMVNGKLYLNRGNFTFEDITLKAGIDTRGQWGTGVSVADVNADGLPDLYLCYAGPYGPERRKNQLFINNGDLTFSEKAAEYGLDDDAHTNHAAFFDYDLDGDLDVYLLNNITDAVGPNVIRPKRLNGENPNTDKLYRNDGGHFTDVSRAAGILKEGYGLGVAISDVNRDGWPDVYVSNDYLSNDLLWINNRNGTFTDRAAEVFRHSSYSSMGCDMADLNSDGYADLVAVDMLPPDHLRRKLMMGAIPHNRFRSEIASGYFPQYMRNTLQLNAGLGKDSMPVFSEIGQLAGIHATDWSWSPLAADLDNDGRRDLLIANGYPRDITNMDFASYKSSPAMKNRSDEDFMRELIARLKDVPGAYLPNYVFYNRGNLQFEDKSAAWGFTQPSFSHGAAVADLDNDGDLDYVANNSYDEVFIYENRLHTPEARHFVRLRLANQGGNTAALGAKVWVCAGGKRQYAENYPFRGYQSTIEPFLHFGIGEATEVDSIVVQWPDGAWQLLTGLSADTARVITRAPDSFPGWPIAPQKPWLSPWKDLPEWAHLDPYFDDFSIQRLLPHKHSQDGPRLSTADVNGDGLSDFFVGGAFRQSGRIFLQKTGGGFTFQELDAKEMAVCEDLGSAFFDADGDGDLDLYVTSGSSEFAEGEKYYQDRLYRNNGKGRFSYDPAALPPVPTSTSCVAPADYDGDGDVDLFVGGRVSPAAYPEIPRSYLLENTGGRYVDVTEQKAPALLRPGMVTDAAWADLTGDGHPELVMLGEWMAVSIFQHANGAFTNITERCGLAGTAGWWNRLHVIDLDGDGDSDLVGGNHGWNHPYQVNANRPLSLYYGDFDKNGYTDPVIVQTLAGRTAPMALRDDLLGWVFPLRKRFTTYQQYAECDWEQLFPGTPATRIDAVQMASCWFENQGNGQFTVHELPVQAQFAPVYGIAAADINADGNLDLVLSGNSSAPEPLSGQCDAFNGLVLLSDGRKGFLPLAFQQSGFWVPGEGRDLAVLTAPGGRRVILAAEQNGPLKGFFW